MAAERARSAVVTGGAQGIGRAVVARLLRDGDAVVAVDRDADALERLRADLDPAGGRLTTLVADVADPDAHERAAGEAERAGPLRAWVNNAAYAVAGSVHETSPADFERGIAVNFGGVFWGTAAAVRAMLASGGGSIVNVSSVQALRGFPGYAVYASTKGAVIALTRQVAAEYAGRGIRCNAVAPGVVMTDMNRRVLADAPDPEAVRRQWAAQCPVGREGTPEDIASTVRHLLGDEAAFTTGQVLVVDGGCTVMPPDYGLRMP